MQLFDNKIYIGHGNSSNSEPAPNAGPIPIVYYDLDTRKFVKPKVTTYNNAKQSKKIMKQAADEEQIDLYKVLNGSIYIPGHDASGENWDFGNFYKLEKDGWKKYRNIPNAIHVYDMAYYQGKLFAAISSDGAEVLRSDDGGKSWKSIGYTSEGARAYTFFTLQNKLYAAGMFYLDNKNTRQTSLLTVNERLEVTSTKVDTAAWLPGAKTSDPAGYLKMYRPAEWNGKLLYIFGEVDNDHQTKPQSLVLASSIKDTKTVSLPNKNAVPYDILIRGQTAYVLAAAKLDNGQYMNWVYYSKDGVRWSENFRFKQDTFARSFEEVKGDFYFGLGGDGDMQCTTKGNSTWCTSSEPDSATGTILKVEQSAYRKK
ncbi:hypothetical protein ACFSL6_01045 [Paenibacillus thailandensis]|uniref:Sortilin N-terminal domain-containing protein n=1 Tax=Paenibacillus thailandensis TaxID=393250 RepID=A0ABW5R337_9BACL